MHLSERERKLLFDCFSKIEYELEQSIDKHSKQLIVSNIELFLNYSLRFYDHEFIARENVNKRFLESFGEFLKDYFLSDATETIGLPSVAYFADKLCLSPNYFGDFTKNETGKSAQEYIQNKIIDEAKNKLFISNKSINEIPFELGFKYPQHFIRLFKTRVGHTPNKYCNLN